MKYPVFRAVFLYIPLVLLFSSCATYNHKIQKYYGYIYQGEYKKASKALDNNKFLRKQHNQSLYLAEKGRVEYLMQNYSESNFFFNQVDDRAQSQKKDTKDIVSGTILNPMMESYRIRDFERFMLHYYKALNYCNLNSTEDATVEARRITLDNDQLNDSKANNTNRYNKDAFSLVLQGILYEKAGDINNAFVAYRNAVELYLTKADQTWYGVTIPDQLKKDVIRTAAWLGFKSEQSYFENKFGQLYKADTARGGSLILFWEHGKAPVLTEQNIVFSLIANELGLLTYQSADGTIQIPIPVNLNGNSDQDALGSIQILRIALPNYVAATSNNLKANIVVNGSEQFNMAPLADINIVAEEVLRENRTKTVTNALIRLAAKKLFEVGAVQAIKNATEGNSNADALTSLSKVALQTASFFSEKADTRNWQTLPSGIQYARIPLRKGLNEIEITTSSSQKKRLSINGTGQLQLYSFYAN